MRSTVLFFLMTAILPIAVPLPSQNVNPMHPEEIHVQKHPSPDDIRARVASLQFQKDAKELAELCASIPGEMNGVNQGLVSKDVLEKLKRVEKLSKRGPRTIDPGLACALNVKVSRRGLSRVLRDR